MNPEKLRALLEDVRAGKVEPDEALQNLKSLPFEDLGFARIDHHRALRTGAPEVIFGEGKTPEQIVSIAAGLHAANENVRRNRQTQQLDFCCSQSILIIQL